MIDIKKVVKSVPSLPETVIEAQRILDMDDVDYQRLEKVINNDIALTGSILRLANSPFYGLDGEVSSIREACIVLGTHSLRSIVLTAAVMNQFPDENDFVLDRKEMWKHMHGTAVCAEILAHKVKANPSRAFISGLLHDMGKLIIDFYYPNEMEKVFNARDDKKLMFREAEFEVLGTTHAQVGAAVAKKWNFPMDVTRCIEFHHAVADVKGDLMVSIVHMANMSARALNIGNGGDNIIPPLEAVAVQAIGWDSLKTSTMVDEIRRSYNAFSLI